MITRLLLAAILISSVLPVAADDSAQANRLLVEAVKLMQAAEQEQPASEKLAKLQSALGKLNQIVDDHPSSDVAVKLITDQEIGSLSLAKLTDAIEKTADRATNHLAHEILQAADSREGVVAGLDEIADPAFRQKVLQEISSILSDSGVYLEEKLFLTNLVEDAHIRDDHLQSIASDQLYKENFQDALTVAELIQNDHKRDVVWTEITKVYARAGNLKPALALAKRIRVGGHRDEALRTIISMQINNDDFQGALSTAELMDKEGDSKAHVIKFIEQEARQH